VLKLPTQTLSREQSQENADYWGLSQSLFDYCQNHKIDIKAAHMLVNNNSELVLKSLRALQRQCQQLNSNQNIKEITASELALLCHNFKTSTRSLGFTLQTEQILKIEEEAKKDSAYAQILQPQNDAFFAIIETLNEHTITLLEMAQQPQN